MIKNVTIYTPTKEMFFEIGNKSSSGIEIVKITFRDKEVTLHFSDGLKSIFKNIPFSIEIK